MDGRPFSCLDSKLAEGEIDQEVEGRERERFMYGRRGEAGKERWDAREDVERDG